MPLDPPLDLPPEAVRAALAPLRHDFSVAIHAPGNAFAVGAIVRVAIGWRQGNVFLPIAHSTAIETPPDAPSPMLTEAFFAWSPEGRPARIAASSPAEAVAVITGRAVPGVSRSAGASSPRGREARRGGVSPDVFGDDAGEPQGSSEHAYA